MPTPAEAAEQPAQEPEPRTRGLYFVRIPRPTVDDKQVKELQNEFRTHVDRVRELNEQLQIKRGERNELRRQISLAKSLRDGGQPEFEEKLARLTDLRNHRKTRVNEMKDIRGSLRGLDARSEAELDEKIAELESRIAYGQVELREEKQIVQQISKLRAQRERVRQYESQNQGRLDMLEGENSKVKAVIAELEAEFNILKGERDQAIKIISELRNKLDDVDTAYNLLDAQQKEVVAEKNKVLETLNRARADTDAAMKDFRDNRKFSLRIRDMVAAGQVEEAKALCEEQVDTWMATLNADDSYRKEYFALWSQQRKYVVSELLPNSAPADVRKPEPRQLAAPGRGGARAPPPKPQGKEKAAAIIAAALEEANKEVASSHFIRSPDAVSDADDSEPEPIVVVPTPAAKKATGGDSVFKHKVEIPAAALEPREEFVVPETVKSETQKLSAEELKANVRAENLRKAAEAEARKKRRQEAVERKRVRAAEAAKRKAEEAKTKASAVMSSAAEESDAAKITDFSAAENTAEDTDGGAEVAEPTPAPVPAPRKAAKQRGVVVPRMEKPVARLPRVAKKDKGSKFKRWCNENMGVLTLGVVITLILLILVLYFQSMRK